MGEDEYYCWVPSWVCRHCRRLTFTGYDGMCEECHDRVEELAAAMANLNEVFEKVFRRQQGVNLSDIARGAT